MELSEDVKLQEDEYSIIFKSIYNNYKGYCEQWGCICEKQINLKSKLICDIYNNPMQLHEEFEGYIHSFRKNLRTLYRLIFMELQTEINISAKIKFSGRVKTQDSIMYKIYKKSLEQNGKFPINSCLNDLLGLRIVDPYYKKNIFIIEQQINKLKNEGYLIRNIVRDTDQGYHGYHIYFRMNNGTFPIELQIWDKENELNNLKLHSEYKQDYVKEVISKYTEL